MFKSYKTTSQLMCNRSQLSGFYITGIPHKRVNLLYTLHDPFLLYCKLLRRKPELSLRVPKI